IFGNERELRVIVEEMLDNIQEHADPPFEVNLDQDVIWNTSRDIDLALRVGPKGSLELSNRLRDLRTRTRLTVEEREEQVHMRRLLDKVQPRIQVFQSCVDALTESVLKKTGYVTDPDDIVAAVRGVSSRIFGKIERRDNQTKVALYRVRDPRLHTFIYIDNDV